MLIYDVNILEQTYSVSKLSYFSAKIRWLAEPAKRFSPPSFLSKQYKKACLASVIQTKLISINYKT